MLVAGDNQALGNEQLQQAHTRGMTFSFDQAIDLALRGMPPPM